MGLFDFFKTKKKVRGPAKQSNQLHLDFSVAPDFVNISSLNDFFGLYGRSPNKEYIVAWEDKDYRGRRSGHRESGYGRCILVKDNQLLYQIDMERPNNGSVADNGMVAINDWRFGLKLNGIFYILEKDGSKLIEHHTKVNLLDCGISNSGELAWCNSASSSSLLRLSPQSGLTS